MSINKGFPNKLRDNAVGVQDTYVTAEAIREKQIGMSVNAHMYVYEVGTDTVEASSTTTILNLTAHAAKIGDIIRFTSGALDSQEVKVMSVATNTVTLAETLSADPSTLTIQILRHKYPIVSSTGALSVTSTPGPVQYVLDGSDQEVTESTGTPANNKPLPTKLVDTTGDVDMRQGVADLAIINTKTTAIEADTASLDTKITKCDTDTVTISAALPAGSNNIGDVDVLTMPAVEIAEDDIVEFIRSDYTSTNVTTAAYVELIASTTATVKSLNIFDSSGQTLVLAIGAAASEVDKMYIVPGGNGQIVCAIPSGSRISIKAISATANSGEIVINLIG